MWDAIIVGAGVCGCAIARELSRKKGRFLVVEKEEDVCWRHLQGQFRHCFTPGLMQSTAPGWPQLNVRGSRIMPRLSRELDVPFRQNGSLVVMVDPGDRPRLQALYENGLANESARFGNPGAGGIAPPGAPYFRPGVAALYAPTGGHCLSLCSDHRPGGERRKERCGISV